MNHNSYMRGPLATARHRARARQLAIVKPLLIGIVMLSLFIGAGIADHNFYMAYGY